MRTVPALSRGLQILREIAHSSESLSVSQLASRLDLPRSAAYELVHTLVEADMLEQRSDGRLGLGVGVFALASSYVSSVDLAREAQDVAREVMLVAHETVQVGRLDGSDVLYLAKVDSEQVIRLVSAVGRRVPAHCTAIGKVLLAHLPPRDVAGLLDRDLVRLTDRSIIDATRLRTELETVRRQGWSSETGESNLEVGCVAAPVLDASGQVIAAMSISVPLARFGRGRRGALRDHVICGARRLSLRLGHAVEARPVEPVVVS